MRGWKRYECVQVIAWAGGPLLQSILQMYRTTGVVYAFLYMYLELRMYIINTHVQTHKPSYIITTFVPLEETLQGNPNRQYV